MMIIETSLKRYRVKSNARKRTLKHWMDKGCTYWKAEKLIERYGYKYNLLEKAE